MSFSILVVVGYWYKGLVGILPFHLKEILVFYYEQFIKQFFFLGETVQFFYKLPDIYAYKRGQKQYSFFWGKKIAVSELVDNIKHTGKQTANIHRSIYWDTTS